MSDADELRRLEELHAAGSLSDAEFEAARQRLFSGEVEGSGRIHGMEEKTWCTLMHLSQLLTYSGLGVVAPIVMWLMSKDESRIARIHGANMMNWMISYFIYAMVSGVLTIILVGIPMLIILAILGVVFPVIAGMKANDNEIWEYPLTIRFISA